MATAHFSLAIDRGKTKDGQDGGADYPSIVCFGKTAELVEKYCSKGMQVGITGKLRTGSYEKDGRKIYTTEILADRVEFLSKKESKGTEEEKTETATLPEGFDWLDGDIPF